MTNATLTEKDADKLDSPKSLAAFINTTPQTVRNLFHAGIIPARIAVGKVIRFDREEAMAALAAHSNRRAAR